MAATLDELARRLGEVEWEVTRLRGEVVVVRDENTALRRCLEAGGTGREAVAAQVHRVAFERVCTRHPAGAVSFHDLVSASAPTILGFTGAKRALCRTASSIRGSIARIPTVQEMIYVVGGREDDGCINSVVRYSAERSRVFGRGLQTVHTFSNNIFMGSTFFGS